MFPLRIITMAMTVAVIAAPSVSIAAPVMDKSAIAAGADEISAQRDTRRRPARPARRPAESAAPQYRSGPDPSIAPDGRPYRVPEYLRNQCYVDDGYGRFSACSNR